MQSMPSIPYPIPVIPSMPNPISTPPHPSQTADGLKGLNIPTTHAPTPTPETPCPIPAIPNPVSISSHPSQITCISEYIKEKLLKYLKIMKNLNHHVVFVFFYSKTNHSQTN
eukprot:526678_1